MSDITFRYVDPEEFREFPMQCPICGLHNEVSRETCIAKDDNGYTFQKEYRCPAGASHLSLKPAGF